MNEQDIKVKRQTYSRHIHLPDLDLSPVNKATVEKITERFLREFRDGILPSLCLAAHLWVFVEEPQLRHSPNTATESEAEA